MDEIFYANLVETWGPLAVFGLLLLTGIGVPLGEDLVTVPAGVLVGAGAIDGPTTAVCAYAGVLLSDFMWYYWCWRFGTPLLHKRWFKRIVHPRRLLEAKHNLEERGAWVIVMSRFVPGSRTPVITAAGVLNYPFARFALAEAGACLLSIPLQLALGYSIAKGVGTERTADAILSMIGVFIFVLAALLALAWWRARRAQRRRRPRAKVAWLRRFRELGRRR